MNLKFTSGIPFFELRDNSGRSEGDEVLSLDEVVGAVANSPKSEAVTLLSSSCSIVVLLVLLHRSIHDTQNRTWPD